jgi:hypothetical protein
MGKSPISMVIFKSKLLVYQRVYKLGTLLSMASKWHQNSLLWKFLSTARPNVTIIPNYRNNFWYWSWEWFQTIYYHSKLLITIIPHMIIVLYITTSDVYIYIYVYQSCTFMYIHVHIYISICYNHSFPIFLSIFYRDIPFGSTASLSETPWPTARSDSSHPTSAGLPWSCDWHAKGGKLLIHWFSKIGKKD